MVVLYADRPDDMRFAWGCRVMERAAEAILWRRHQGFRRTEAGGNDAEFWAVGLALRNKAALRDANKADPTSALCLSRSHRAISSCDES